MIVVICSGGPSSALCSLERFLNRDDVYFIGADRGAQTLFEHQIVPDMMIGDFDSIDPQLFKLLKSQVSNVIYANVEKDETDTDLALNYAFQFKPSEIVLTCVAGGRMDHEEAAKRSLLRAQLAHPEIKCVIETQRNRLQYLVQSGKKYPLIKHGQYISFFAVSDTIQQVTLRGVKFETTNEPLSIMSSRFTSNEILDGQDAHIIFSNGICLMITSAD